MKKITLLLLMLFLSITSYSQLALEGFESTTGPAALPSTNWTLGTGNWAVFDNGVGTGQRWGINTANVCSGAQIAYVNREFIGQGNTSEDYLATPLVTIPTNGELHFFTKSFTSGNQGTIYQIRVAPATATQTNPAAYTLVQQWTETELTAVYNVCEEKIVDLSAYAGQQIFVSFVMIFTQPTASLGGDRWLVDNVSINQKCLLPTGLTATGITFNGANLNWANPSGATSWEIEVIPVAATPTGVGVVYSGTLPYPVTGLLPNTTYKYYVRALCSTGYTSAWSAVSPNFTTASAPPVCGGNFIDSGGTTANYTNNSNTTTTICPVTTGDVVTVTFTTFSVQNGFDFLKVYNGSDATAPLLANLTGTTLPPSFTSSATNGCLTFVFTSNASVTAPGWASNVSCAPPPTCPQPIVLTTSNITPTTATLGWTNVGSATAWQVLALPCGSPAPTATTTGWIDTTTNPYNFSGLTSASCYNFYVRGVCSPTDNSGWAGPITVNTPVSPPVCGGNFVDAAGPTTNYANNSDSTVTICPTVVGQQVTVTFTAFNTEANWDALYVFDGNSITAPQIASANPAANVPGGLAGGFWGTTIPGPFTSSSADGCLTFRFRSDGSVSLAGWIANVTCAPPPTCQQPTALTTTALTFNSVSLGWTNVGVATSWQVLVLPCGSPAPTAVSTGWVATTTNPYVISGLSSATCYNLYVRGDCGSTSNGVSLWSGPRIITTLVAPPICGGNFVDAAGPTANYANNSNVTTTICPTNPGEIVTVTFTSFNTEANWDGLYVYDGNAVNPATQIASANPAGNVPGGLAGSYWGNTIPGPFTSTTADGCLTFVFRSDGSVNNPGWIANITCSPAPTCARPTLLTATNITQTSALLSWTQPLNPDGSQATAWEILVLPAGSPIPTTSGIPATSPYLATGLSPGTAYVFYVRAICTPTDNSIWSALNFAALPVNDECINATFAIVNQNLNCVQTTPGTLSGATGSLPTTTCPGVINDDVWFTFTATAVTHIISFNNVLPATALNYAIFQGTDCGALTQVGCNSGANLVPGTTYYIRVYSATAIQQFTNFNLCIGTLPCVEAPAFCTGQTVTYANSTNIPSLGQIGCLFTSPNPAFFFLQVNQAGPLSYLISQVDNNGVPRDVDYVAWGPFTDLTTACSGVPANPLPGILPALTPAQGCQGTLHACSYSAAPTEIMCIPNAQLCQVYVIMITNFSNQAGTVTFTQTNGGGGTTECFPINTFNYPATYYCQNGSNPTPVLAPGASSGVYTSTAGLVIDSVTGTIDLAASTPGPYIVTSTTLTSTNGACTNIPSIITTRTVIITAAANATIAYANPTYCNTDVTQQNVTLTGTIGGTYTASPTGLLISQNNGQILPIASVAGVYTVTYTVPAIGGCVAFTTTTTVEILAAPVPTFTQVAPICPGDTLADLPTTSNNGITGTWSPAMNNTATTTYTFTPTTGVCARTTTMTIGVGSTTPAFTQVAPICPGALLADLPTTSNNGVTGTWSPAMDNTTTTIYTFTATPGLCAGAVQMTIQVLTPTIVPTFTSVAPICPNGIIANLPTTSNNGITGVWSPALDNTVTTIYTFTPDTAQCALTTTLTIIVNPELVVTVNSPSFCPGSTATVTATPAIPGVYTYTWTVPAGVPDPGNIASFTTSTVGTYSVVITQTNIFCNTDFESPTATGATPNLFNENLVPCWDTTAADGVIEIWPPGFEGVTAYSGNQLIELNANTPGTLFQDFNVIPGTSIAVQFAHRGRQGNDVVGVEIGPIGGPYVSLGNFTDNNTAWGLHAINYTIPTGNGNNYTLRFVSVSSTGGNPSVGNLLDSISISSLSCPSQSVFGIVSLQNLPDPTVTITQPTCALQTGTIEVTTPLVGYEYSLDNGTYQLSTTFVGVSPGNHTITVHDLNTGCFSLPLNVTIDPVPQFPSVTTFSYPTPVCQDGANPVPNTSTSGFTSGGTFTSTTGLTIDSVSGLINLVASTSGTYTITYSVTANPSICLVAGSSVFEITINPVITPVTTFTYTTPVCAGSSNPQPNVGVGFTSGGTFSSTAGLSINSSTGEISLSTTTPGTYTVTYSINADATTCQLASSTSAPIVISNPVEVSVSGECVGVDYILTANPVGTSFDPNAVSYLWEDSTGLSVGTTQSITVVAEESYTATVVLSNGCSGSANTVVDAITCVIQKGISPNNDTLNDTFNLTGWNVKNLGIYNRYGAKVYSQNNYTNQWGGQTDKGDELPDGTYYFVIERDNGETRTGWIYINREI